jgi:hypothetical protein
LDCICNASLSHFATNTKQRKQWWLPLRISCLALLRRLGHVHHEHDAAHYGKRDHDGKDYNGRDVCGAGRCNNILSLRGNEDVDVRATARPSAATSATAATITAGPADPS